MMVVSVLFNPLGSFLFRRAKRKDHVFSSVDSTCSEEVWRFLRNLRLQRNASMLWGVSLPCLFGPCFWIKCEEVDSRGRSWGLQARTSGFPGCPHDFLLDLGSCHWAVVSPPVKRGVEPDDP